MNSETLAEHSGKRPSTASDWLLKAHVSHTTFCDYLRLATQRETLRERLAMQYNRAMHATQLSIRSLPTIHENPTTETQSRRRSAEYQRSEAQIATPDKIRTTGSEGTHLLSRALHSASSTTGIAAERSATKNNSRASVDATKHFINAHLLRAAVTGRGIPPGFDEMTQHITPRRNRSIDEARANATVRYYQQYAQFSEAVRNNLAVCYLRGRGTETQVGRGIDMLRSAAAAGSVDAEFNLAFAHEHAVGTHYDPQLAAQSYKNAAAQGHPRAMMRLALMHEIGSFALDPAVAAELKRKANAAGSFETDFMPDFALS